MITSDVSSADHEQLRRAFAVFNETSEQLSGAYKELQTQVTQLTKELAVANGELHRQLVAKEDLSQRLTLLLTALPAGVIALDAADCVEQVNPAAISILGKPLMGLPWSSVLDERLSQTTVVSEWNLKQDNAVCPRRVRIESNTCESTGRRILLVHNITEAHAMQEQVRRNQRLTSMGEMAANLAHQLRTPLSTALLYATHLGDGSLAADERQQFASKTTERLHHLEHLINDMLRFVKGETTQLEEIVVSDLLVEMKHVIEPQMAHFNLKFIVYDNSEGISLLVDNKALCGALTNLLENAMQFSCVGDCVVLTCDVDSNAVMLTVSDDGPGIDMEVQERLFEPFFTTRSEGTGLGLAIVRGVIQSMGGSVQVNSLPNAGCEFVIRLPRNKGVS